MKTQAQVENLPTVNVTSAEYKSSVMPDGAFGRLVRTVVVSHSLLLIRFKIKYFRREK